MRGWHETYASQGLVVIGNHYPEFSYEADIANLRAALVRLDVPYAVAQDNDRATWNAYNNRYWPALYLIDKRGHIRYRHIGEGGYDTTENAIQDLLRETYTPPTDLPTPTPLTYLKATTDLNVRGGPSIEHTQIGAITPNEAFIVRGQQNGWYIINYNGSDGYVSGDYVTLSN